MGVSHFSFAVLADPISLLHRLEPQPRLALLGMPVKGSRSPEIHNARIKQLNLPWSYVAIDVRSEELQAAFDLLRKKHFLGFNITMPHKQEALSLVDQVTEHARLLGSINTVAIRNGKFFGSNTDGPGFVAALKEEWNFSLRDRSVLLLGASGGAGRALAMQAAMEGCSQLFLSSRTPDILQQQTRQLLQLRPGLLVEPIGLDKASLQRAMPAVDLVVNATPIGFLDQDATSLIPSTFFQPRHYLYDLVYGKKASPLIQAARASGAHAADGFSMLQLQGALCFKTWLGKDSSSIVPMISGV